MHPADASERGLLSGTVVEVRSRVGAVQVPLELSDEVMRGVVSLPHGFGHSRPGTRMKVAEAHAGVSLNDLTDDQELDELSGNAAFSGIPVSVTQFATVARPLGESAPAHA
jgi:anaerobic selenocysteine-containing dehydrogenase